MCLHLTFNHSMNPTPVNMRSCQIQLFMHDKILQKKTTLLKRCDLQIQLCLFMLYLITLKQLKSLTLIDTFSCLKGREVTRQAGLREVPDSIPGYVKDFYVHICFLLSFSLKIFIYINMIIRVSRYRHSIFNNAYKFNMQVLT